MYKKVYKNYFKRNTNWATARKRKQTGKDEAEAIIENKR